MEQKQQCTMDTGFDLRGLVLVAVGVAWLLGIVLASFLALPSFALLVGAAGALFSMLVLWQDKRGRLVALLLGCLLLGMWRYTIGLPGNDSLAVSRFIGVGSIELKGSVTDEPRLRGRLRVLNVMVSNVSQDGGQSWRDAHGPVEVQILGTSIEDPYGANYGDVIQVTGKLQSPASQSPPGTFASIAFPRLHVVNSGGNPVIAWLYSLRSSLAEGIAQSLPQPEAALLVAVLLGLHTAALKVLGQVFNVTGTAHLIATSGFKVTILAGFVMNLTRRLSTKGKGKNKGDGEKAFPQRRGGGWRAWLTTGLVVACIAIYSVLSGAGPAALRAGIMGSILALAPRFRRSYNVYTALSLTALLMSALDPFVLWDVGFQLSFLGTLGIVLLTPLFQHVLHPLERVPFGYFVGEMVAVTLAAQVATLPIFAASFQQISFIAPIANSLTVPLLGTMILLGLLLCISCLLFSPLALLCGWVAFPVLWYVQSIVDWCANLPYAYITVGSVNGLFAWGYYGLLGLLTYFLVRRRRVQAQPQQGHGPPWKLSRTASYALQGGAALLVVVAMGAAALTTHANGVLTVMFFDLASTGKPAQGEAIFVRTPEGRTALIDGGLDAGALAQALDSRLPPWQRSLDVVVLTSPRADHLDGLLDIINRYTIGMVCDAGMLHPSTTYALWRRRISERHLAYKQLSQGATIAVGMQVALQVLSPGASLHKGSNEIRDNGLVLRLNAPGLHMLLLGASAESKYALAQLGQTLDQRYLQAEIVQIEGVVNASFPDELGSVLALARPSWLVITPALPGVKQRKAMTTVSAVPPSTDTQNWQVVQTAQIGGVEINCTGNVWTLSTG